MFKNIKTSHLKTVVALFLLSFFSLTNYTLVHADGYERTMTASSTGVDNYVRTIGVQQDNKIIIGGYISGYNGQTGSNINNFIRLNESGTLDDTYYMAHFGGLGREIMDLKVLPDDSVIMVGSFTEWPNFTPLGGIVKLDSGGVSVDLNGLDPRFDGPVNAVDVDNSGYIYVAGSFSTYGTTTKKGFARLDSSGILDTLYASGIGFTKSGYDPMYIGDISLDSNGNPYIVGNFDAFNGTSRTAKIIKLNSGGVDTTFSVGTGFDAIPTLVQVDPDGKILVYGESITTYKGQSIPNLVRLNPNGSLDETFDAGTGLDGASLNKILFQDDGKMILVGSFDTYDNNSSPNIVRINRDGSYDSTFVVGTGFDAEVYDAVFDMNGDLIIGGYFSGYNGQTANRIARLVLTDNTAPLLVSFTSNTPNGTYLTDEVVEITADFDQILEVGSTMDVVLNTGRTVTLSTINGTNLSGTYVVQEGDSAAPLAITGFSSVSVSDKNNNIKNTAYVSYVNLSSTKNIVIEAASNNVTTVVPQTRRGSSSSRRRDTLFKNPLFIAEAGASVAPVSSTPNLTSFKFADNMRDLQLNIVGDDVKLLQQFLNAKGFIINPVTGQPGSVGFETSFFGEKTRQALIKLQQKYNITPAVGYFGPKTRGVIKTLSI